MATSSLNTQQPVSGNIGNDPNISIKVNGIVTNGIQDEFGEREPTVDGWFTALSEFPPPQPDLRLARNAYWSDHLSSSIPAELPVDRPRDSNNLQSPSFSKEPIVFDQTQSKKISQFTAKYNLEPLTFFVALFRALHYRMTLVEDATISASRGSSSCLAIRLPCEGATPFWDLCDLAERMYHEGRGNEVEIGREAEFVKDRIDARVLVTFDGKDVDDNDGKFDARLDLVFQLFYDGDHFAGTVRYLPDIFTSTSVENLIASHISMAIGALESPALPLEQIEFVNALPLINSITPYVPNQSWGRFSEPLGDYWKRSVAKNGDLIVCRDSKSEYTYRQMDEITDKVARRLCGLGSVPEARIGVFMERSCEYLMVIIASVKAGFAWLPLDLGLPVNRVETILEDQPEEKPVVVYANEGDIGKIQHLKATFVKASNLLGEGGNVMEEKEVHETTAGNLAYVTYTSGSTGKPKGVMIEHKSVLAFVHSHEFFGKPGEVWLHIAKIAFDVSAFEIWPAILTGGTVLLISDDQVLDLPFLRDTVKKNKVAHGLLIPAFLTRILAEVPDLIEGFQRLYIGGDAVPLEDARKACSIMKNGQVAAAWGPSEACFASATFFELDSKVPRIIAPLGEACAGDLVLVLDSAGRPVPPDVFGEICVAGDGLARGYTDPDKTKSAFVNVELDGFKGRIYKTGDWGRWRAADGHLEFGGRQDSQVKLRGFRIELSAIEHSLRSQRGVNDAAAIVDTEREQLVAFVVPGVEEKGQAEKKEGAGGEDSLDEQVSGWKAIWDQGHYADIHEIEKSKAGRDFAGWNDMITGIPHPREDMDEWLNDMVNLIHSTGRLGNAIEIGFGTGMMLFNLDVASLDSYSGLDISTRAVNYVSEVISRTQLAGKATVKEGTADNITSFSVAPDTFIMNSVAQYFPSRDYFRQLFVDMIKMFNGRPGRAVFGDMRSLPLFEPMSATWAIHNLKESYKDPSGLTSIDLRKAMKEVQSTHTEFLVDPVFFFGMQQEFPDAITHVEISPKAITPANELSRYRYQALIWFNRPDLKFYQPSTTSWRDYSTSPLTEHELENLVSQLSKDDVFALKNVPNSKLNLPFALSKKLLSKEVSSWDVVMATPPLKDGLDPHAISSIAAKHDFRVDISWARQGTRGIMDLVFSRLPSETRIRFPEPDLSQSWTNSPVTQSDTASLSIPAMKDGVRKVLPYYFVPDTIHILEQFPLNMNGKIDRRALKEMLSVLAPSSTSDAAYTAPANEVEATIVSIFEEVLKVKPFSSTANFFESGGHSLLGVKVIGRLHVALPNVHVTIRNLFDNPTAVGLASVLANSTEDGKQYIPSAFVAGNAQSDDALSKPAFGQERLYFLEQLTGDRVQYIIPVMLRLRGGLNVAALEGALNDIQNRHEVLRTIFVEKDDMLFQRVLDKPRPLEISNLQGVPESGFMETLMGEATKEFDLTKEPGYRARLWNISEDDHILGLIAHHIFYDGGSSIIFAEELGHFYSAREGKHSVLLPELPIQYRDFVIWQRQAEQQAEQERQLSYWVDQLKGSRPGELPCDFSRPSLLDSNAGKIPIRMSPSLQRRFERFLQERDITPFIFFLSVLRALMFRITAWDDVTIGMPIDNRNQPELETLIGFFVNTQAMRIQVEDSMSVQELLQVARTVAMNAYENQDVSFDSIVRELQPVRDRSRNPIVQVVLGVHPSEYAFDKSFPNLDVEHIDLPLTTHFDMEFQLFPGSDGVFRGHILYSKGLCTDATVKHFATLFQSLIPEFLSHPTSRLEDLAFPTAVGDLNQLGLFTFPVTPYPREDDLGTVFKRVASAHPTLEAVKDLNSSLKYKELDELSDNISLHLAGLALPSEAAVAVFSDRSCGYVASLLGILKAGLSYIPLDPQLPSARIRTILEDVSTPLIVLHDDKADLDKLAGLPAKLIYIPELSAPADPSQASHRHPTNSGSLAYKMYTSGSTGKPKGVMVEHRGIVRLSIGHEMFTGRPGQRWAHVGNTSFDISTGEIYPAILNGGTVVCIDRETILDSGLLAKRFSAEQIDVAMITPALLHRCLEQDPDMFRTVTMVGLGGDVLDVNDAKLLSTLVKGHVVNAIGHTENTTHSASYKIKRGEDFPGFVPVGKSWSNSTVFVLDKQRRLVPPSVVGTIYLGGDGLARGYTDPEKTRAAFVEVVIEGEIHRLYDTGDRGRYRASDGEMEFLGRQDFQVKIRGHRIELGEIESTLSRHPLVSEAVALVHTDPQGDKHLLAFVKAIGTQPSASDLKDHVGTKLPRYMIPVAVDVLPEFPLGTTGKVDRKALAARGNDVMANLSTTETEYVAPAGQVEMIVCQCFAEVLAREKFGVNHSFFNMGGHSLIATRVISRISRRLGVSMTVADLFDYPRPVDLATALIARNPSLEGPNSSTIQVDSQLAGAEEQTIQAAAASNEPTLASFGQERLWFLDQLAYDKSFYLIPLTLRIKGSLDIPAVNSSINLIRQRHDVLRTIFVEHDGHPLQKVLPFEHQEIPIVDLAKDADPEASFNRELRKENTNAFNLASEPGIRVTIFRLDHHDHVLSIVLHHIISDGWSMGIIERELLLSYNAFRQDKTPVLAPLPIQYKDFSAWQRSPEQEAEHKRQLSYWVEQLRGNAPAQLPTDFIRPPVLSAKAGVVDVDITGTPAAMLHAFAVEHQLTPFVVILAAVRALHYRITGTEDAVFGSPIANRNQQELEDLIGFFVNVQAMRIQANGSVTFRELVYHTKDVATAAFSAPDVAFEWIVKELQPFRDPSRNPIVQMMVSVQPEDPNFDFFHGASVKQIDPDMTTRHDAEILFIPDGRNFHGRFIYSADLFRKETVENFMKLFVGLLEHVLKVPDIELDDIAWLNAPAALESLDILEPSRPVPQYQWDKSLGEWFLEAVEKYPHNIAVEDAEEILTYTRLNKRADAIATFLLNQNLPKEAVVAVFSDRSVRYIACILGIVKAGMCYLPMDVNAPKSRVHTILEDVPNKITVMAQVNLDISKFDGLDAHIIDIDSLMANLPQDTSLLHKQRRATGDSLAYIMYTSGSTGKPKGVMIEHHCVARIGITPDVIQAKPGQRWSHTGNPAFDLSTWEVWAPLLNGATVVCIDRFTILDLSMLSRAFISNNITCCGLMPALVRSIYKEVPEMLEGLDVIVAGGDVTNPHDAKKIAKVLKGTMYNVWAPTEACVMATAYGVDYNKPIPQSVPIGPVLAGCGVHVLDRKGRLVPPGVIGEAFISGVAVGRGYTDQERTQKSFVNINVRGKTLRTYRTGDLVRWRAADANLDFIGRADSQVKLRGQRIELAEIEDALTKHPKVKDAAVVLQTDHKESKHLVSFVVPTDSRQSRGMDDDEKLRAWQELLEENIYPKFKTIPPHELGHNFVAWNDPLTDEPIAHGEMEEWLQDLTDLLHSGVLGNVLEIMPTSGLTLFNLNDTLKRYIGIEPSPTASEVLREGISQRGSSWDRDVDIRCSPIADISKLKGEFAPDTVVFNSAIQYFPSAAYLEKVLLDCISLGDGRPQRLVLSDVRSLPLDKYFRAFSAVHQLDLEQRTEDITRADVTQRMKELQESTSELLIDPWFFYDLQSSHPELTHVEVRPKFMPSTNFLSQYRYEVTLWVNHKNMKVIDSSRFYWYDYQDKNWTQRQLVKALRRADILAIQNIPNRKLNYESELLNGLKYPDDEDWLLATIFRAADRPDTLSPHALKKLGKRMGFRVDVSSGCQRRDGTIDVVFSHLPKATKIGFKTLETEEKSNVPASLGARSLDGKELQRYLKALLPPYMVPNYFVIQDDLPWTSTGKVDRKLLTSLTFSAKADDTASEDVAPRNESENLVVSVFKEVLGLDRVSVLDSFFEIGGHSLLATKIVSRLRQQANVPLSVRDVFDEPTPAGLARKLATLKAANPDIQVQPIERLAHGELSVSSFAQERLWFLDQLQPGGTSYLMPSATRFKGPLVHGAMEQALKDLMARHETLRTVFITVDGRPMQKILSAGKSLKHIDLRTKEDPEAEMQAIVKKETKKGFDLSEETCCRPFLIQLRDEEHVLLLVVHHINSDGWSFGVFNNELAACYEARKDGKTPALPELAIQYRDFAFWQREPAQLEQHSQQLAYWTTQLAQARPGEFPTDFPRPNVLTGAAGLVWGKIEEPVVKKVLAYSKKRGVTPFIVFLAVLRALHYRMTLADDATIGTAIANRNHKEIESLIGFFVNMQPMRIRADDDMTFDDLCEATRTVATAAFANQDVPFERIVQELQPVRDTSRNPLAQVSFAFHDESTFKTHFQGFDIQEVDIAPSTRMDTELNVFGGPEGYKTAMVYSSDLFSTETAERMMNHFITLSQQVLEQPNIAIGKISFPDAAAEVGNLHYPEIDREFAPSIPAALAGCVSKWGTQEAVVDSNGTMTFEQLDKSSDKVANYLLGLGLKPESRILVFSDRTCTYVATLFGILKAGLAYIPVDPALPPERVKVMLEDNEDEKKIILWSEDLEETGAWQGLGAMVISIQSILNRPDLSGALSVPETHKPGPTSLAYLIYTSGSTGRPKGVMIEHKGVVRLALQFERTGLGGYRTSAISNTAFDISTFEIFATLFTGGTVICVNRAAVTDPVALAAIFEKNRVKAAVLPPAITNLFLESSPQTLKSLEIVLVGGDVTSPKVGYEVAQLTRLYNAYGPTESTVTGTAFEVPKDRICYPTLPIGRPLAATKAFILDRSLNLTPQGIVGELYLGGRGVARGYTDPARTATSFITVTINGIKERLYKTGDGVVWRNGEMEYLCRLDNQLKIRGQRAEAGEIESSLRTDPAVRDAVVVIQEDFKKDNFVVAFVTSTQDESDPSKVDKSLLFDEARLKRNLGKRLPKYMVPSVIRLLPNFPLTTSAKVDRKRLSSDPEYHSLQGKDRAESSNFVAPRNWIEDVICQAYAETLKIEKVGIKDSFFDLGGHSLLATKAISRIQSLMPSIRVSVRDLFSDATPEALAAKISLPTVEAITELFKTGFFEEEELEIIENGSGSLCSKLKLTPEQLRDRLQSFKNKSALSDDYLPSVSRIEGVKSLSDLSELIYNSLRRQLRELVFPTECLSTFKKVDPDPITGKLKPRLYIVHDGFGTSTPFKSLVPNLDMNMYAIIDPHFGEDRLKNPDTDKSFDSIPEAASFYLERIEKNEKELGASEDEPLFIAGWCYGSMVVSEMTHQLQKKGRRSKTVVIDPYYLADFDKGDGLAPVVKGTPAETMPLVPRGMDVVVAAKTHIGQLGLPDALGDLTFTEAMKNKRMIENYQLPSKFDPSKTKVGIIAAREHVFLPGDIPILSTDSNGNSNFGTSWEREPKGRWKAWIEAVTQEGDGEKEKLIKRVEEIDADHLGIWNSKHEDKMRKFFEGMAMD